MNDDNVNFYSKINLELPTVDVTELYSQIIEQESVTNSEMFPIC